MERNACLPEHRFHMSPRERFWLSVPIFHNLYVHPRKYALIAGIGTMFMAAGGLFILANMIRFAEFCYVATSIMLPLQLLLIVFPCWCGKQPILTAKAKREFMTLTPAKVALCVLGGLMLGISAVIFLQALGPSGMVLGSSILFLIAGLAALAICVMGPDVCLRKAIRSEKEHKH